MKSGLSLMQLAAEIQRRSELKRDFIAPASKIEMEVEHIGYGKDGGQIVLPRLNVLNGQTSTSLMPIQDIAHGQIAEYVDIPMGYYRRMLSDDPALLTVNVNRWLKDKAGAKDNKRMVRTLEGEVRAMLSNGYRTIEYEDLANAVLPVLMDMDLMVLSCQITERKLYIKCVDRRIERDVPTGRKMGDGTHVFFDTCSPAITISDSEVGYGMLSVETGVYTSACTNLAMIGSNIKKRHVGKKQDALEASLEVMLTDETKRANDRAMWLTVRDVVKGAFEEAKFDATVKKLGDASKDVIPAESAVEVVEVVGKRFNLTEGERKSTLAKLIESGDLTRYGLHAAVTRASADIESYDRATELEGVGGDIIELDASQWRAISDQAKSKQ